MTAAKSPSQRSARKRRERRRRLVAAQPTLTPNERIFRGLAAMARALTAGHAWTTEARAAYRDASHAVPRLGLLTTESRS